jgi:outer membrane biosynthesis protein TonB
VRLCDQRTCCSDVECRMLPILVALLFQLPVGGGRIPAGVLSAVAPSPPLNAISGTCVLADFQADKTGKVGDIAILQGTAPFSDLATRAIKQWKFVPANANGQSVASRISALLVFRPAAIGTSSVGGPSLGYKQPSPARNNHAPLPLSITDPGYPQSSIAKGVVIIELTIDKNGVPSNMRTVQDVPGLTDVSRDAIRSWKFMPAVESGAPVDGTLVVTISFLQPVQ